MARTELNCVEILSRVKSKTFCSWKHMFVGGDEGTGEIFLVVNKVKGIVLKMGEN